MKYVNDAVIRHRGLVHKRPAACTGPVDYAVFRAVDDLVAQQTYDRLGAVIVRQILEVLT